MPNVKKHKTITLLLPTLNEIDGIKAIFPHIDRSLFDDILIVDGGSTDGTVEYAIENNIRIMTQLRKGLGAGVMDAIDTLKTDCVIEFSLDGNCMVDQLSELTGRLRQGYDLVVVSRYLPPAKSYDDSVITAFGNFMFTRLIRWLGRFPVTDSLTIYRGFDLKMVRFPEFSKLLYGPVFEPLISAVASARNLKVYEIPGDEPARIGGESKMSVIYNGSCILLMIIRMYWFKIKRLFSRSPRTRTVEENV
jgi:glycosyltransferase involved in cell wall biosynthesis